MYGGGLGACAVLGPLGTMRLSCAVLGNLASGLRDKDPSLSLFKSYCKAFNAFFVQDDGTGADKPARTDQG
jgi:hypothetical protein